MHWVPLEYADWMPEVRPLHHASARPRLHVPRDVLKRTIQAEPSIPHSLRCWYACDVPIGQEHPTEQTFFRKTLTHPVLNTPLAVWVPCNRLQQPIWPGYVLAVSDTALDARELSRLRLTLSGFLGGPPWIVDPMRDLPWEDIALPLSWMPEALRPVLGIYRAHRSC